MRRHIRLEKAQIRRQNAGKEEQEKLIQEFYQRIASPFQADNPKAGKPKTKKPRVEKPKIKKFKTEKSKAEKSKVKKSKAEKLVKKS